MDCDCLLCFVSSIACMMTKTYIIENHTSIIEKKFIKPHENCPFKNVWEKFMNDIDICCCLKHLCKTNEHFCECKRCNILTVIQNQSQMKVFNSCSSIDQCICTVCTKCFPKTIGCSHSSCEM